MLRLLEKVRYGWRRRRTLVRFLALKFDEIWGRLQPPPNPRLGGVTDSSRFN